MISSWMSDRCFAGWKMNVWKRSVVGRWVSERSFWFEAGCEAVTWLSLVSREMAARCSIWLVSRELPRDYSVWWVKKCQPGVPYGWWAEDCHVITQLGESKSGSWLVSRELTRDHSVWWVEKWQPVAPYGWWAELVIGLSRDHSAWWAEKWQLGAPYGWWGEGWHAMAQTGELMEGCLKRVLAGEFGCEKYAYRWPFLNCLNLHSR